MLDGPEWLPQDRYIATSELLGEGGMARVWRAWHRRRATWCAVKILRDKFIEQADSRRRFIDESRTLLKLAHRNVIAGWDSGEGERPYLVMEVADAGTLKDWVVKHGAMPPRMAVGVAIQMCKGLRAAHERGVIHRDVKPHNVLVNRKGVCKISDFGIARIPREDGGEDVPDATTAQATDAMGTMGYMAPEQRSDPRRVDPRTDVYGVGASLYDLLTGHPLHNLFMADREPDMLTEVAPALRPVLLGAVKFRPEERYASVLDFARQLHAVRESLPPDPADTAQLASGLGPEPPPPMGLQTHTSEEDFGDLEVITSIPRGRRSIPPAGGHGVDAVTPATERRDRRSVVPPPPRPSAVPSVELPFDRMPTPAPRPPARPPEPHGHANGAPAPPATVRSPRVDTPDVSRSASPRGSKARKRPRRLESADDLPTVKAEATRISVVVLVVLVLLASLLAIDTLWVWSGEMIAVSRVEKLRSVVKTDAVVIDMVAELGGSVGPLNEALHGVIEARGPSETVARSDQYLRTLRAAREEVQYSSSRGRLDADRVRVEMNGYINEIGAAHREAEEGLETWRGRARGLGCVPTALLLVPAPPEPPPDPARRGEPPP